MDEVGRGALAGPLVAAAVILPPDYADARINDSKKLTPALRSRLRDDIIAAALAWSVGVVSHEVIDEINIAQATYRAMNEAIARLNPAPEFLLVDGARFPAHAIPCACIIKGDAQYQSIAAASIVAKTWRDEWMAGLDAEHPAYRWAHNKGYQSSSSKRALKS